MLAALSGAHAQTPFTCTNGRFFVSKGINNNISVYDYNPNTGVNNLIVSLGKQGNGLAYNPTDNMLWIVTSIIGGGSTVPTLSRIDATGVVTNMSVTNLTLALNSNPTAGGVTNNGYYVVNRSSSSSNTDYYVVDINPARATYLQVVDPANGYAPATAPYYKTASASLGNFADFAYNSADGLFYALNSSPGTVTVRSLNIVTGAVTTGPAAVLTNGTALPVGAYGGASFDATGRFIAMANTGVFYSVDIATGTTIQLGNDPAGTSINTDATACPTAVLSSVISGNVYHDIDGLTDNTVNGVPTTAGTTLYVILYDHTTGQVAGVTTVAANGTYSFGATPGDNFSLYLTTNSATVGQTSVPVVALPAGWANTGENIGAGAGNDGSSNGILPLGVTGPTVSNANFGIQQLPTAATASATPQTNPGGTNTVVFPPATFGGTDQDGTVDSIVITAFPANTTSIIINGVTYTASDPVWSSGGVKIPAPGGIPSQTILVDPMDGGVKVTIPYKTIDNAGMQSTLPGTADITFTTPLPILLSGFSATRQDQDIRVTWKIEGEQTNTSFEVQHSRDGASWTAIHTISATDLSGPLQYAYVHQQPGNGTHYYRLKITDDNGSVGYSAVSGATVTGKGTTAEVHPNPSNGVFYVQLNVGSGRYDLRCTDLYGRILATIQTADLDQQTANKPVVFDLNRYPAGMYLLSVSDHYSGGTLQQLKLLKE